MKEKIINVDFLVLGLLAIAIFLCGFAVGEYQNETTKQTIKKIKEDQQC